MVGELETLAQQRVVKFFQDALGYAYLGDWTNRPDIVLYVNGIALGVLELKRSIVSVAEGIRQNLDNQKKEFIRPFFSTMQLIMAGNETEGLRYAMIETPEKYWLRWKEAETGDASIHNPLLSELGQLCNKRRLIEIIHDFIVFDSGIKKICRHNQYFGVKAAQEHVKRREGGIIWHTQGLTDLAKAQLKQRWGTMQQVLSSQDRLEKIVADILVDMEIRNRLKSGRGNALLVSGSIYSACRFFEMFQQHGLSGRCAIVTSYKPTPTDIKGEEAGEGLTERLRQYDIYRKMLAAHFDEPEDKAMRKVGQFEKDVKKRFIEQPGQMKLLIVVDKLLTGFDAPSATYLYIDKKMRDHSLFQAICRVNRLDGEDKEYGYIIDYKDLFRSLEQSIKDYTGEAFDGYDREDVEGLLKDRLEQGRARLEEAREAVKALCEPVEPPRDSAAFLRFFCAADSGNAEQLKANEPKRVALYRQVTAFLRAYADLANEMRAAGYSDAEAQTIRAEADYYEKARQEVKLASGDYIDMKMYEPAMRHLLDTYIRAEESVPVSVLDDLTLVQLIVERGEAAVDSLPEGIRNQPEATTETIENNVRRLIIDQAAVNPRYYERMSKLLDALILQRKQEALEYKTYLAGLVELTRDIVQPETTHYPPTINSPARQALYDNLREHAQRLAGLTLDKQVTDTSDDAAEAIALKLDDAVRAVKKADWRGNRFKEREVRNAIRSALGADKELVNTFFEIVKAQRDY